jgi:hypothetical protein
MVLLLIMPVVPLLQIVSVMQALLQEVLAYRSGVPLPMYKIALDIQILTPYLMELVSSMELLQG